MQVITNEFSARELFEQLINEARERAAELTRECRDFSHDMNKNYIKEQTKAIHNIRRLAMEVLDMIDADCYDEDRIKAIRAFYPKVSLQGT